MQYSLSEFPIISSRTTIVDWVLGRFLLVLMTVLVAGMECSIAQKDTQGKEDWGNRPVIVEIGRFAFVTSEQGEHLRNAITTITHCQLTAR